MKLNNFLLQMQKQTQINQLQQSSQQETSQKVNQTNKSAIEDNYKTNETQLSIDNSKKLQKNMSICQQSPGNNKTNLLNAQNDINSIQSYRDRTQLQQQSVLLANQNNKLTPTRNNHNLKTIPSPKNQNFLGVCTSKQKSSNSQNTLQNNLSQSPLQVASPPQKLLDERQKTSSKNINQKLKQNEFSHSQSLLMYHQQDQAKNQKCDHQVQQVVDSQNQKNNSNSSEPCKNVQVTKLQNIPSTTVLKEFIEGINKQKNINNSNSSQLKTLQTQQVINTSKSSNQCQTANSQNKSKSPQGLKKQNPLQYGILSSINKKSLGSAKLNTTGNVNQQKYQIFIDTNEQNSNSILNAHQQNTNDQSNQISAQGLLSQKNAKKNLNSIISPSNISNAYKIQVKTKSQDSSQTAQNQKLIQQMRQSKVNTSQNLYESQRQQKFQCQSMFINNNSQTQDVENKNQINLSQPDLDTLDSDAIAHYTDLITLQTQELKEEQFTPNQQKSLKKLGNVLNTNLNNNLKHSLIINEQKNMKKSFEDKKKSQSQEFKSSRQYNNKSESSEQIQKSQESLRIQLGSIKPEQQETNLECNEEFEFNNYIENKAKANSQPKKRENQLLLQSFTESLQSSQDTRRNNLDNNFNLNQLDNQIICRNDNCFNHQSKKGKYHIELESLSTNNQNLKSYCSKCAIELVSQGIKVIENESVTKKNVIDSFLINLRSGVNDLLNNTLKLVDEKDNTLHQHYQKQLNKLNNFYDECINLCNQLRSEDIQKLVDSQNQIQEIYNERRNIIRSHIIDVENMNKDISSNIDQIIHNIKLGPFKEIINQYQDKCNEFINYCEQTNQIQINFLKYNIDNSQQNIQSLQNLFQTFRKTYFYEQSNFIENLQSFQSETIQKNDQFITDSASKSIKKQDSSKLKNQLYVSFDNRDLFFQAAKIASAKKSNQNDDELQINQQNQESNIFYDQSKTGFQNSNNQQFENNENNSSYQNQLNQLWQQNQNQFNENQFKSQQNIQNQNNFNINQENNFDFDQTPNPTFGNREQQHPAQLYDGRTILQNEQLQQTRNQFMNQKLMNKNNFQSLSEARLNQIQVDFLNKHIEQNLQSNSNQLNTSDKYSGKNQANIQEIFSNQQSNKNIGHKVSQSSGNILNLVRYQNQQEQQIPNHQTTDKKYKQQPLQQIDEDSQHIQFNSAQKNPKYNANSNVTSGSTYISTSKKQNDQIQENNKIEPQYYLSNRDTVNINSFIDNYNLVTEEFRSANNNSSYSQHPSASNFFTGQSTCTNGQDNSQHLNKLQTQQNTQCYMNSSNTFQNSKQEIPLQNSSNSKHDKQFYDQQRPVKNLSNFKPLTLLPSFVNEDYDSNRYQDSNRAEISSNDRNKDSFRSYSNNKQGDNSNNQRSIKYIDQLDNNQENFIRVEPYQAENQDYKKSPISSTKKTQYQQNSQGSSKRPPAPSPSYKMNKQASPSIVASFDQLQQSKSKDNEQNFESKYHKNSSEFSTGKKKKYYDLHLNLSAMNKNQSFVENECVGFENDFGNEIENEIQQINYENSFSENFKHKNSSQKQKEQNQFQNQLNQLDQNDLVNLMNKVQNQQLQLNNQMTQQQKQQNQQFEQNQNDIQNYNYLNKQMLDKNELNNSQQANYSLQMSETIEKNDVEQSYNCMLSMQYQESDHDSQSQSIVGIASKYSQDNRQQKESQNMEKLAKNNNQQGLIGDSFDRNISVTQIQLNESQQQKYFSSPFQKQEQNFADSINSQNQNLTTKNQFFYSPQFKEDTPNLSD
ncbi:hypothetical protein TTHERM_00467290 (macronuclear) [Tetrahymena thermophila SB210]|uniref:Uncharacterized protein n=1 Tax=Tetrahymena thermophila (strain SB210) TaxID=312017 RepID=I7MAK6_TETTS|nr:hypothetical protein TTHERM_00467290 [Tetrahymena thermophila SB210]EAS04780.2 hypothetical protein TTHERM_00467290 [Tetrahymena thermophila SB210]|eukprot:XP_001025025.2 hypothetical protein TTHERM_00467290 [Tetrahymena thermophila SB210]